jgi:hypothetical protein
MTADGAMSSDDDHRGFRGWRGKNRTAVRSLSIRANPRDPRFLFEGEFAKWLRWKNI